MFKFCLSVVMFWLMDDLGKLSCVVVVVKFFVLIMCMNSVNWFRFMVLFFYCDVCWFGIVIVLLGVIFFFIIID